MWKSIWWLGTNKLPGWMICRLLTYRVMFPKYRSARSLLVDVWNTKQTADTSAIVWLSTFSCQSATEGEGCSVSRPHILIRAIGKWSDARMCHLFAFSVPAAASPKFPGILLFFSYNGTTAVWMTCQMWATAAKDWEAVSPKLLFGCADVLHNC